MKAKELIEVLKMNPDADVLISVDVSTCDDDFDKRAFADTYFDYQIVDNRITLIFEGYSNY